MDIVPPAIARIANMGMDVSGIGRNTLTPVLNREEAMREWEQRQSGRQPQQPVSYPQLEYLQQQAELHGWNQPNTNRYAPHQPSQLHFQAPPVAVIVDSQEKPASGLREVTMSTSRSVGRYDQAGANSLPTPAQAYAGSSSSNRFPATFQQPTVPYDTYDHRDGMGTLYIPLQPHQYQSYGSPSSPSHGAQQHQGSTSSVSSNTSLYGSSVVAAGPQSNSAPRNPFSAPNQSNVPGQDQSRIDPRPLNDADIWPR
jgi:dual specificity protein kinase YAK1